MENEARSTEPRWWIPVSFTYEGDPEPSISPKFWLGPDTLNFTMKDPASPQEWLLVNVHGTGKYEYKYFSLKGMVTYIKLDYLTEGDIWI